MILDLSAPHTVYKTKDGSRCPGTTTVLGVLNKPSLLSWYSSQEREGIFGLMREYPSFDLLEKHMPRYKNGKPMPFAEVKRDKAADVGTVTHARIEAWLKGTTLDPEGIPPEAYAQSVYGLDRFMAFWDHERLSLLASERVMVSEVHRVGGTADVIASIGKKVLVDIKTTAFNTSWPYHEHIAQASAYAMIAEEEDSVPVDEVWLVRVGKDENDRTQVVKLTETQRSAGLNLFFGALACYKAKQVLG